MCVEVCMVNVTDGAESPRWMPAIVAVRAGERAITLECGND